MSHEVDVFQAQRDQSLSCKNENKVKQFLESHCGWLHEELYIYILVN